MNASPASAWYRQPILWLALLLPAAIVVAAAVTLAIAMRDGSSDAAPDSVRRTAQTQVTDLAPDLEAQRRGLSAVLDRDADDHGVRITLTGPAGDQALALHLVHPAQASRDVEIRLVRTGTVWLGRSSEPLAGRWRLRLQPTAGDWRLVGHLPDDGRRAELQPAFATP